MKQERPSRTVVVTTRDLQRPTPLVSKHWNERLITPAVNYSVHGARWKYFPHPIYARNIITAVAPRPSSEHRQPLTHAKLQTPRCNKWEQGEIPYAHARFLGLRTADMEPSFPSARKTASTDDKTNKEPRRNISPARVEEELVSVATATTWGKGDPEPRREQGVSLRGEGGGTPRMEEGNGDRFLTYWSEKGTDRPVKVLFFNDAAFQVSGRPGGRDRGWGMTLYLLFANSKYSLRQVAGWKRVSLVLTLM